jgi:hypothetical protein
VNGHHNITQLPRSWPLNHPDSCFYSDCATLIELLFDPLPLPSPAMAQYLLDIFYSLSNCLCCFPGSPQLRINSRSFRMLRLLGEVRFIISNSCFSAIRNLQANTLATCHDALAFFTRSLFADLCLLGWLLLRLSNPRYIHFRALRPQEDSLPLRPRIRLTSPQRSRSLHSLCSES